MSSSRKIVVVGGGAAGFFAAIAAAESSPKPEVTLLERGPRFLAKVRISGGGRCNVTHACFQPKEFSTRYPRGERALISPFTRFQAADTVEWFARRGVELKVEEDGRMFPVTDSSETVIECLEGEARRLGVKLCVNLGVDEVERRSEGGFALKLSDGTRMACERLLLATGGCRTPAQAHLARSLGHTIEPPVPSLFTFQIESPWLRELAGTSLEQAEVSIPEFGLREKGPMLVTHWGLSGPAVLRLSAWGARVLHDAGYRFPLLVNWLPGMKLDALAAELDRRKATQPAKYIVNSPVAPLSARLWEKLCVAAGVPNAERWAGLSKALRHALCLQLTQTKFQVVGKSLNKDEFVTCGGVRLSEVDFKTMESRICPGLYFAGELLDIDGITGGFNFQSAWTTGWIAGHAMTEGQGRY